MQLPILPQKSLGKISSSRHSALKVCSLESAGRVGCKLDPSVGLENFWSLLKRGIKGTYVSVEPFHLYRYLDEQAFRFNEREDKDSDRFVKALGSVSGRRFTYSELIGEANSG